jgi:hypothetical protein
MNKKKMTIVLGVGTLGYWIFREFKKSDGTFRGTMRTAGKDMQEGYDLSRRSAKRLGSALRTGVQDWRNIDTTDDLLTNAGNRKDRGNGGISTGKVTTTVYSSEPREQK